MTSFKPSTYLLTSFYTHAQKASFMYLPWVNTYCFGILRHDRNPTPPTYYSFHYNKSKNYLKR